MWVFGNLFDTVFDSAARTQSAIGNNVAPSLGSYIGPKWWLFGAPFVTSTADKVADVEAAQNLWKKSSELTHTFSSVSMM